MIQEGFNCFTTCGRAASDRRVPVRICRRGGELRSVEILEKLPYRFMDTILNNGEANSNVNDNGN